MSWASYIDNLKGQGVQEAGIFGLDGNPWAVSPGMSASKDEVLAIIANINSNGFNGTMVMGGVKYIVNQCEKGNSVTSKVMVAPKEDQKYLSHSALGKSFIMIGMCCGPQERGATHIVEKLKEYLAGVGY